MTSRARVAVIGVLLIVATNAIALGGALYNRSGTPESRLMLSNRELTPPYRRGPGEENSGLALNISWRVPLQPDEDVSGFVPYNYRADVPWLDEAKLSSLGFDTSLSPDASEAERRYRHQLSRKALIVLELDGPARAAMLQAVEKDAAEREAQASRESGDKDAAERARSARGRLAEERDSNSRLFAVDAGLALRPLREKYPDTSRYAIVAGHVGIGICPRAKGKGRQLCGYLAGLEVTSINVPLPLRPVFDDASPFTPGQQGLRYTAEVAFGRRLEPWLVSAERAKP